MSCWETPGPKLCGSQSGRFDSASGDNDTDKSKRGFSKRRFMKSRGMLYTGCKARLIEQTLPESEAAISLHLSDADGWKTLQLSVSGITGFTLKLTYSNGSW